jgi:hypothetical protein
MVQYLSALSSMGLVPSDIEAILAQDPSGLSDAGLGRLLEAAGLDKAAVSQAMADSGMRAQLKEACVKTLTEGLVPLSKGPEVISMTAPALNEEAVQEAVPDPSSNPSVRAGESEETAAGAPDQSGGPGTGRIDAMIASMIRRAAAPFMEAGAAVSAGRIQAGVEGSPLEAVVERPAGNAADSSETLSSLENAGSALEELETVFDVSRQVLRDLVFSNDASSRERALDQVKAGISARLGREGIGVPRETASRVLGLMKGVLSKDEYAAVEKAWTSTGHTLPGGVAAMQVGRGVLEVLTSRLGDASADARGLSSGAIVDQVRQAVSTLPRTGEGSVSIRLHPPMLGRVDVDIFLDQGKITASFKVDQPITRDIIQQNMNTLKEALAEQGIKASQFVVTTDTFSSPERQGPLAWFGSDGSRGRSAGQGGSQGGEGARREGPSESNAYGESAQGDYVERGGLDLIA